MSVDDDFEDLALRLEYPPPPIYTGVLQSLQRLRRHYPDGVPCAAIGLDAWDRLPRGDRSKALLDLLTSYATRVCREEAELRSEDHISRAAADPTKTYLESGDVSGLWDAAMESGDRDVEVSRGSLINALSELELLRHRLDMRDKPQVNDGFPF